MGGGRVSALTSHGGAVTEPASWVALAASVLLAWWARALGQRHSKRLEQGEHERLAVAALSVVAAALSVFWVHAYVGGAPRIVDAATYLLEAKALARGMLRWPLHELPAAELTRFLVTHEEAGVTYASGIFPIGYPLALALGVLVGAPMAVGPLLAAGLVVATWWLAREATEVAFSTEAERRPVRLAAAAASALSAVLRYHTADTMSHGLVALCIATGAAAALRVGRTGETTPAWLAGVSVGWALAARPVSGAALAVVVLALSRARLWELAPRLAAGAAPFVAIWLLHQRMATGSWLASSQLLYYAQSDGPPGCFRYGFGDGVGCLGEHGDFVRAYLEGGYGAWAALGTTGRRLWMHLADAANAEPLWLGVALGMTTTRRALAWLWTPPALLVVGYAPFYFDGNYPGGGGRMLADALPVEHVAFAIGVSTVAKRLGAWPPLLCASALSLGFALRGASQHALLRDRDLGRPELLARELDRARSAASRPLVFTARDVQFTLGFEPGANEGPRVVRTRGLALDWLVWDRAGRPIAYTHELDGTLHLRRFETTRTSSRVEGEDLWPAYRQRGGHAFPAPASGACASGGWRLPLVAAPGSAADVTITLHPLGAPVARARLALGAKAEARLVAEWRDGESPAVVVVGRADRECHEVPLPSVPATARWNITATQPSDSPERRVALDAIDLSLVAAPSSSRP